MAVKVTASLDDQLTPGLQKMKKQMGDTGDEADDFRKSFFEAAKAAGATESEVTRLDDQLQKLARTSKMTANEVRSNLMKELDARKVARFREEINKAADGIGKIGSKSSGGSLFGAGLIGGVAGGIASKAVDIMKEKFMEAGVKSAINDAFSLDEPLGRAASNVDAMVGKLLNMAGLLSNEGYIKSIMSADEAKWAKLDADRAKRNKAAAEIEAGKQKELEKQREKEAEEEKKRQEELLRQKVEDEKRIADEMKLREQAIFEMKRDHERMLEQETNDRLAREEQQQLEILRIRDEKMRAAQEKEKARVQSILDLMKQAAGGGSQQAAGATPGRGRVGLDQFAGRLLQDITGSRRGQRQIEREARQTAFGDQDKAFAKREAEIRQRYRDYAQSVTGAGGKPLASAAMEAREGQAKELRALAAERDAARRKAFGGITQENRDQAAAKLVGERAQAMGFGKMETKAIVDTASGIAQMNRNSLDANRFLQQIANNTRPQQNGPAPGAPAPAGSRRRKG